MENDFLKEEYSEEFQKMITLPTESGTKIGIWAEKRSGHGEEYMLILYNKQAQEYIVQNIEKMLGLD